MLVQLDPPDRVPIFQQLVNQVRRRIASSQLKPGDKLPTVRELAVQLVINPNTVQKAYIDLSNAGLVHSRKGQGLYVSEIRPTLSLEEGRRRVTLAADEFITEGLLLGYKAGAIQDVFEQELTTFAGEGRHDQ